MTSRGALYVVLLILGCLMVPVALTGIWVKTVLLDTDRYVAAVAPLIERPAVQQAVAGALSDQIVAGMDLGGRAAEFLPSLPGGLEQLAQPLVSQVEYYTRMVCTEFVSSNVFRPIWVEANRQAHRMFVATVRGEGPLEISASGVIALNLDTAATELNRRFQGANLPLPSSLIPSVSGGQVQVAVIKADPFLKLRSLLFWVARLYIVLPILAALCLVGGVLLGRRRLLSLAAAGTGIALVMIALEVGRAVGGSAYRGAATRAGVPADIANALWQPLVGGLDFVAMIVLIMGVGMVAAAIGTALLKRPM